MESCVCTAASLKSFLVGARFLERRDDSRSLCETEDLEELEDLEDLEDLESLLLLNDL